MSLPRLFLLVGLSAALPAIPALAETGEGDKVTRVAVVEPQKSEAIAPATTSKLDSAPAASVPEATVADAAGAAAAAKPAVEAVKPPPPAPTLKLSIDLTKQQLTVSENGKTTHTWSISSGRSGYRTPTGHYRPQWMTKMHYSRKYDNAPMPHSIFFHNGFAIHATYATGMLGRPASHGCIRLSPSNAKKLYGIVGRHGRELTRIAIHGVAKDAPSVASNQKRTVRRSYEPSPSYYRTSPTYSFGYPSHARTWPGDRPRRLRYGY